LAHDLGHPPFGHLGEEALNKISTQYNGKNHKKILPRFTHEAQSLRVLDLFKDSYHPEPLNLTYEVRDGVVCHYGEKGDSYLRPSYRKDIRSVDTSAARRQRPATLEGCVTRVSDRISYLGRDFEDACMAEIVKPEDLPSAITSVLGNTNSQIIGSLVDDLVKESAGLDHLRFSDRVFSAMEQLGDFNYEKIYKREELWGQKDRIHLVLHELFQYFLFSITDETEFSRLRSKEYREYPSLVFGEFLSDMSYTQHTAKEQMVIDFIAGMTDNFAMSCFESLFHVKSVV
jgi:dGTPase